MVFPKLVVIADRFACDSVEEWTEKSLILRQILNHKAELGLQIRNKSDSGEVEMNALIRKLVPHKRLWINGGWSGFQSHLRASQQSTIITERCGISVHTVLSAKRAEERGAAYVQAGPIFNPFSKPVIGCKPSFISEIADVVDLPIVAVGGLTPSRTAQCFESGASAVATISWVMNAPSIETAINDWLASM